MKILTKEIFIFISWLQCWITRMWWKLAPSQTKRTGCWRRRARAAQQACPAWRLRHAWATPCSPAVATRRSTAEMARATMFGATATSMVLVSVLPPHCRGWGGVGWGGHNILKVKIYLEGEAARFKNGLATYLHGHIKNNLMFETMWRDKSTCHMVSSM